MKWDVLGITETHLTASTLDNLLRIPGYDFVRKDRSSPKGGGVLIYYHKNLTVHQDLKWDIQELEAVWINVTLHSQSTLIGCLYRPPKDMTFFSSLQALLNKIWVKRKNVVLIGDLNSKLLPASRSRFILMWNQTSKDFKHIWLPECY